MKEILTVIKREAREVVGDLVSCKNRFKFLESNASNKHLIIFMIITLGALGIIIFSSGSQAEFYFNFLKLLFVLLISFFVFCQSDCFWFLIIRAYIYDYNIKHRRHMRMLLQKADEINFNKEGNLEGGIILTAILSSSGYKRHAIRYVIEICFMLFILLYIMPDFFLYNLVIFIAMFVYVSLYERQSKTQAFADIIYLINSIKEFIKEDPKKCRDFILESKHQEIRDLKKLYKFVLESTEI